MTFRTWLDASPLASVALALMRDATGREHPLEPLTPTRAPALPRGRRIGVWSLCAGVGASTLAALIAHRSAEAEEPPLLVDLDRWAPSLALRAGIEGAGIADALLRPGREAEVVSRWRRVPFLPAAPGLQRIFDGRVVELVERLAGPGALVADLGAGADALDAAMLALLDDLLVVAGTRAAELQAAFCAVPLLAEATCRVGLVVVGADPEDAASVARRLPWPLRGAIPRDAYLAEDRFAVRAPTQRALDLLIRGLA